MGNYPRMQIAVEQTTIKKKQKDKCADANLSGFENQITVPHTMVKKRSLLKYSISITNIPTDKISAQEIMSIYRARWRIEIIFKQWKSCLRLDIFKGFNKDRFHCFMYGRLIMAILMGAIGPPLMRYAFELGYELSCYKLINYLIADHMLFRAIQENTINELVRRLLGDIPRRLCMEKRKLKSLRSNIREGVSYYNLLEMSELELIVA
jgi:hypothetical protein